MYRVAATESDSNGDRPVQMKAITAPKEKMSLAEPMPRVLSTCSGDMNDGVPITWPVMVIVAEPTALAIPKSIRRGPWASSSTLDG